MAAPFGPYTRTRSTITAESRGLSGLAIQLGPFGGSEAGPNRPLWTIAYFAVGAGGDARDLRPQGPLARADSAGYDCLPPLFDSEALRRSLGAPLGDAV